MAVRHAIPGAGLAMLAVVGSSCAVASRDAVPPPGDPGPAIRVRQVAPAGLTLPSLARVGRDDDTLRIEGTVVTPTGETRRLDRARVEPADDTVTLRDLPEGEATLRIRVGNRYFLPHRWVEVGIDATLVRGRTLELRLPIAGVGGAIDVVEPGGGIEVVRAVGPDGAEARARVAFGRALLGNLPAGVWRVDGCVDTACREVRHVWERVEVGPLETIELRR